MKTWSIQRVGKRKIRITEDGISFSFKPIIITGQKSILSSPDNAEHLLKDYCHVPYADNNGHLPITMALGMQPKGKRLKALVEVLKEINDDYMGGK